MLTYLCPPLYLGHLKLFTYSCGKQLSIPGVCNTHCLTSRNRVEPPLIVQILAQLMSSLIEASLVRTNLVLMVLVCLWWIVIFFLLNCKALQVPLIPVTQEAEAGGLQVGS